ncbi:UPF0755 protein [Thermovibrio guaymasensis]|uniref:Endolytic murein transglycosylase n=1 Tax=Thermovibrio guaymasensis TaxID=240167 RepID=A0A420W662_9BACT|nr:endolytic transglycosylase MltG [Thermovibrio guaymasensis]RKQ60601.1 UPF0755 protein [Thermovibrio guaymasensis]
MKKFIVFLLLIGVALSFLYVRQELFKERYVSLHFEVKRGETLKEVVDRLSKEGVTDEPTLLYYFGRYKGIEVKSGCYDIKGKLSPVEVLKELTEGRPCLKSFTIVPGSNIFEVDKLLSQKGFCKEGEVLKLSKDKSFLKGLKVPSLEGFIYPDTYFVNRESSCREVLKVAVSRFHSVVDPLFKNYTPPDRVKKALKDVDLIKIVTVASIVEKETSLKEERPLIAAVIYNRLKRGMKVQCDPTVIYALKLKGVEKERLLYKDLTVNSPYNTYLYSGLPPGPICNPSLSSIEAALYPADVNYLYFVANGRGGHTFSRSYNQHLKEVRKYRKWLNGS